MAQYYVKTGFEPFEYRGIRYDKDIACVHLKPAIFPRSFLEKYEQPEDGEFTGYRPATEEEMVEGVNVVGQTSYNDLDGELDPRDILFDDGSTLFERTMNNETSDSYREYYRGWVIGRFGVGKPPN